MLVGTVDAAMTWHDMEQNWCLRCGIYPQLWLCSIHNLVPQVLSSLSGNQEELSG